MSRIAVLKRHLLSLFRGTHLCETGLDVLHPVLDGKLSFLEDAKPEVRKSACKGLGLRLKRARVSAKVGEVR